MADGKMPGKSAKDVFVEDLTNKPHAFVRSQLDAIGGGDTGAFLAAMLEGVQAIVCQLSRIGVAINPKNSTVMTWLLTVIRDERRLLVGTGF